MNKTILPYDQTPQLAKTDVAYAMGDPRLRPFYQHAPELAGFAAALQEKSRQAVPRADLVAVLRRQYADLETGAAVQANIEALADAGTFAVVTAHQPSLLLGPLYFVYKALSTINLAEAAQAQTGHRVVPIFVLGSEDHDLEELNKANLFGKRLVWEPGQGGPVGQIPSDTLAPVLDELRAILGESPAAQELFARVAAAYAPGRSFAAATRALLHGFLGRFGLLVLDMGDAQLKKHLIPVAEAELLGQQSSQLVGGTIAELSALGFKAQAPPREINLFYLLPGQRQRIVLEQGGYRVLNTDLVFSAEAILAELRAHPERFSPNVVLRPLYQELVLPNLAYVGGGGELAYWLERKALFAHFGVAFPMLLRRHSLLWLDKDAGKKLAKFGFTAAEFFGDTEALVRGYVGRNAAAEVDLSLEIKDLQQIFQRIETKAVAIDPSLEKALRAEAVKASAGLEQWQGRLLRAEKQKHETTLNQLRALKEKLFPGNGLQERSDNFLPYVLKYGDAWFDTLRAHLQPFDPGFVILSE
jgi:bacillithiol biosynthesis cysteine-adding enzyme BshC